MSVVEELTYTPNVQARRQSLGKALETAGVPVRNEDYGEDERGRRQVQELARRIVTMPSAPTALFAASDTQAVAYSKQRTLSEWRSWAICPSWDTKTSRLRTSLD